MNSRNYRPEIDGLRAVAILPVVLFHAGIQTISGGFTGVDVFFVISGYLISRIIITETELDRFSYRDFYDRRIRRILPALMVVIIATLLAMWIVALPNHLMIAAKSGTAAIFAVSNFYFWLNSGYFAPASEFSPFLHSWSLGVEEQFYILLPPALLILKRLGVNLKFAISMGCVLLFAVGCFVSFETPSFAFYLLPARSWELALGALLAVGAVPRPSLKTNHQRLLIDLLGYAGFALILAGYFYIDSTAAFPGWVALFPCLGAAMIIHAGRADGGIGRLLALPPIRFIGLISYSWYLWHWPIFVTLRMILAEPHLPPSAAAGGVIASFILAVISWQLVEKPFRDRTKMPFRRVAIYLAGLAAIVALLVGLAIATNGGSWRIDAQTSRILSSKDDTNELNIQCAGNLDLTRRECTFGANNDEYPSFVVVGDSHAEAIQPAVEAWAKSEGRKGVLAWRGECPLLLGAVVVPDVDHADCTTFKNNLMRNIVKMPSIDTVFFAGRWEAVFTGRAPEIGGAYRTYVADNPNSDLSDASSKAAFERSVRRTMTRLTRAGKTVIILGAVPEAGFNVPELLALSNYNGQNEVGMNTLTMSNTERATLDEIFAKIAQELPNVFYVSLWRRLCDPECRLMQNGVPIYRDDDHLTMTAAKSFVGPMLAEALRRRSQSSGAIPHQVLKGISLEW